MRECQGKKTLRVTHLQKRKVSWREHKNYIIVSVPVSIKLLQKHWKTLSDFLKWPFPYLKHYIALHHDKYS